MMTSSVPLGPAHEVTDQYVRRNFNEHVHVIAQQCPIDDGDAHLITDLLDELAPTEPHLTVQHLIPILRCPDAMIVVMRGGVTA
jgi:hypothetical protein